MVLLVLMVLVPFLFWRGTWFGRPLSEKETGQYLADTQRPRRTQHALVQIAERILRGDPEVKQWYPQIQALATHERPEVRSTAAWVMGQDNRSEEFHRTLPPLLRDPEPSVRYNAALSLVRFGDTSGREQLRQMLLPYPVTSPQEGTLLIRLKEENPVNPGTLLGRVQTKEGEVIELRSPLPGTVRHWQFDEGESVRGDEVVVFLSPGEEQAWEALRALYLVGEWEDLEAVEPFARGVAGMPERIQQQAQLTMEAIRRRAGDRQTRKDSGPG